MLNGRDMRKLSHMLPFRLLCLFLLIGSWVDAQYAESIRSGRPGQSIGPYVTGTNIFQVQSGLSYSEASIPDVELNATDFNTVLRFGLSEYFEINGAITYAWLEEVSGGGLGSRADEVLNANGITQAELGVRTNIYNSQSNFPSIGFQYRLKFPSPTEEFRTDHNTSIITLVTQQNIGKLGLLTNWGIDWVGNTGEEVGFYIINLSTGLSDNLGIFVEQYGFFNNGEWLGKFDGGLAILVNNDLQLDLFGGWGSLGQNEDSFFVSTGVSWRTSRKKK